jgi:hypothetical protein
MAASGSSQGPKAFYYRAPGCLMWIDVAKCVPSQTLEQEHLAPGRL